MMIHLKEYSMQIKCMINKDKETKNLVSIQQKKKKNSFIGTNLVSLIVSSSTVKQRN